MKNPRTDSAELQPTTEAKLADYRRRPVANRAGQPWKRYAAATGAAVAGASTAEAAIVHVVPENPIRLFRVGADTTSTDIDFDGDGVIDASFFLFSDTSVTSFTTNSTTSTTFVNYAEAIVNPINEGRVFVDSRGRALNFSSGELVSSGLPDRGIAVMRTGAYSTVFVSTYSASSYTSFFQRSAGEFADGVPGLVGLQFNSPRGAQFAWVRVTVNDSPEGLPEEIVVTEWAYDDTGAPIRAGEVPEPTGLALLAAGAAGVAALRRRSA